MKSFQFRLARVRRAREISESLARADWQAAERNALDAEHAREELRDRIREARAQLGGLQSASTLNPSDILASDRALAHAAAALAGKRKIADERRATAEESRLAWTECERDRLALERLEERQKEVFRGEVSRAEDAETDEWAATHHRGKSGSDDS